MLLSKRVLVYILIKARSIRQILNFFVKYLGENCRILNKTFTIYRYTIIRFLKVESKSVVAKYFYRHMDLFTMQQIIVFLMWKNSTEDFLIASSRHS